MRHGSRCSSLDIVVVINGCKRRLQPLALDSTIKIPNHGEIASSKSFLAYLEPGHFHSVYNHDVGLFEPHRISV